jgi:hypothetical protein
MPVKLPSLPFIGRLSDTQDMSDAFALAALCMDDKKKVCLYCVFEVDPYDEDGDLRRGYATNVASKRCEHAGQRRPDTMKARVLKVLVRRWGAQDY